jgi:hypothetical protein
MCRNVLQLLLELRRWSKNFKNGKSFVDQKPGDMQPKLQKKRDLCELVVASLLVYGRHFQNLQLFLVSVPIRNYKIM